MSTNIVTVSKMLEKYEGQIQQLIPRHLNIDRVTRLALGAVRKNAKLAACTPKSLVGAIVRASQLGLEIDDDRGLAYLVPFKREATLIIGYKGFIDLAYRSPKVLSIQAVPVFEGDEFSYERGLTDVLHHKPTGLSRWDADKLTHVYAICRLVAAPAWPIWDVLTRERIESHRARSRAKDSGPWVDDYIAMAQKTGIRVIQKWCPKSIEMQQAVNIDERAESDRGQGNEEFLDTEWERADEGKDTPPVQIGADDTRKFASIVQSIEAADTPERIDYLSSQIDELGLPEDRLAEAKSRLSERARKIQS